MRVAFMVLEGCDRRAGWWVVIVGDGGGTWQDARAFIAERQCPPSRGEGQEMQGRRRERRAERDGVSGSSHPTELGCRGARHGLALWFPGIAPCSPHTAQARGAREGRVGIHVVASDACMAFCRSMPAHPTRCSRGSNECG